MPNEYIDEYNSDPEDWEEEDYEEWFDPDDDEMFLDPFRFANPGSALRAETPNNPRNLPCPTCKEPNRLTPADVRLGYQCDECADRAERGGDF